MVQSADADGADGGGGEEFGNIDRRLGNSLTELCKFDPHSSSQVHADACADTVYEADSTARFAEQWFEALRRTPTADAQMTPPPQEALS